MKFNYYIYLEDYAEIEKSAIIDNDCDFLAMFGLGFDNGESIYLEKRLNVFFYKDSLRGEMTDKLQIDINGIVLSRKAKEILDAIISNISQCFLQIILSIITR